MKKRNTIAWSMKCLPICIMFVMYRLYVKLIDKYGVIAPCFLVEITTLKMGTGKFLQKSEVSSEQEVIIM
jgi:hypothetical protein